MKTTKIWMLAILFLAIFAVSCDNSGDDPVNEAKVLVEYLESSEVGDYAATAMAAIQTAGYVKTMNTLVPSTNYIIDIRAAADYDKGHIENAVNVPAADILTHLDAADLTGKEEIHVVCYSGQSAAWATCLLRLSGYDNAFSMKFGMSSWNEHFAGSWNNSVKSGSEFTDVATEKAAKGSLPALNTGFTTGPEILDARIQVVLDAGFGAVGIGASTVFQALDNYYIANYWSETDYTHYGSISGAMQYTPKVGMSLEGDLETLPTDQEVVVYCWTGQTSANMAAYLSVIGYNAKTLKFGANGMIYNDLEAHKWSEAAIIGADFVGTEAP
jgi:rhodanese-related sulfurtransferase